MMNGLTHQWSNLQPRTSLASVGFTVVCLISWKCNQNPSETDEEVVNKKRSVTAARRRDQSSKPQNTTNPSKTKQTKMN